MSFGELLFQLSPDAKKIVRGIEALNQKIINTEYAVIFNETCLKENLLPVYTNIYIYIYIK